MKYLLDLIFIGVSLHTFSEKHWKQIIKARSSRG